MEIDDMKSKYETAEIEKACITVDVSNLGTTEEVFFNATDMAKPFNKIPAEWLRLPDTGAYIEAILNMGLSHIKKCDDVVRTKRGKKNGGTWLHQDLGLAFARWLSPMFAVRLDRWTRDRLKKELTHKNARLDVKTNYIPMTRAIFEAHEVVRSHHFSNENNLIYTVLFGLTAKKYKENYGINNIRDHLSEDELRKLDDLQVLNTAFIKAKMPYQYRKECLVAYCQGESMPFLMQANR
jgi:hypothetical protein